MMVDLLGCRLHFRLGPLDGILSEVAFFQKSEPTTLFLCHAVGCRFYGEVFCSNYELFVNLVLLFRSSNDGVGDLYCVFISDGD